MPSLDDVYRKFGEASEAAQLLETELGTLLLFIGAADAGLVENPDPTKAMDIYTKVNRQTLGQLLKQLKNSSESLDHLEALLAAALKARNRLSHSFYREHNFRRNTEDGRALMLEDLEKIHTDILDAFKAVMRATGVDLDTMTLEGAPTGHLPI